MQENDYIDFNFSDLPEMFYHDIDGVQYRMRLYYNKYDDSYHIDIWDQYDVPLVMGEKLVYGEPLWGQINDDRLPMVQLTPIDDTGNDSTVNRITFPSTVKLEFLDSVPDVDDDLDDIDSDSETYNDEDSPDLGNENQADDNDYGNDPTAK